jgi:hypothetical protein
MNINCFHLISFIIVQETAITKIKFSRLMTMIPPISYTQFFFGCLSCTWFNLRRPLLLCGKARAKVRWMVFLWFFQHGSLIWSHLWSKAWDIMPHLRNIFPVVGRNLQSSFCFFLPGFPHNQCHETRSHLFLFRCRFTCTKWEQEIWNFLYRVETYRTLIWCYILTLPPSPKKSKCFLKISVDLHGCSAWQELELNLGWEEC